MASVLAFPHPRADVPSIMKALIAAAFVLGTAACERHEPPAAPPEATPAMTPPPSAPEPDATQPETLVGVDVKKAGEAADRADIRWRIVEEDGKPRPATMDYRPDRLNFIVKDGKVIRVNKG